MQSTQDQQPNQTMQNVEMSVDQSSLDHANPRHHRRSLTATHLLLSNPENDATYSQMYMHQLQQLQRLQQHRLNQAQERFLIEQSKAALLQMAPINRHSSLPVLPLMNQSPPMNATMGPTVPRYNAGMPDSLPMPSSMPSSSMPLTSMPLPMPLPMTQTMPVTSRPMSIQTSQMTSHPIQMTRSPSIASSVTSTHVKPMFPTHIQPPSIHSEPLTTSHQLHNLTPITHPGKSAVSNLCSAVEEMDMEKTEPSEAAEILLGLQRSGSNSTEGSVVSSISSELLEETQGSVMPEYVWEQRQRMVSTPVEMMQSPMEKIYRSNSSGTYYHRAPLQSGSSDSTFWTMKTPGSSGTSVGYQTIGRGESGWSVGPTLNRSPSNYYQPYSFYGDAHYRTNTISSLDSTVLNSPRSTLTNSLSRGETLERTMEPTHSSDEEWNNDKHSSDNESPKKSRGRTGGKGTIEWKELENGQRVKIWRCNVCKKEFATSAYLSRHARIHSDSRPYACSYPGCHATFKRSDHAKAHERGHEKRSQERAISHESLEAFAPGPV